MINFNEKFPKVKNLKAEWIDGNLDNLFYIWDEKQLVLPKWNIKKYNGRFENKWEERGKRVKTMFQLLDDKDLQEYDIFIVPYDDEF